MSAAGISEIYDLLFPPRSPPKPSSYDHVHPILLPQNCQPKTQDKMRAIWHCIHVVYLDWCSSVPLQIILKRQYISHDSTESGAKADEGHQKLAPSGVISRSGVISGKAEDLLLQIQQLQTAGLAFETIWATIVPAEEIRYVSQSKSLPVSPLWANHLLGADLSSRFYVVSGMFRISKQENCDVVNDDQVCGAHTKGLPKRGYFVKKVNFFCTDCPLSWIVTFT